MSTVEDWLPVAYDEDKFDKHFVPRPPSAALCQCPCHRKEPRVCLEPTPCRHSAIQT